MMRDSEKAGMNRIVLPLAGIIAALALVGIALAVCAKIGVFKVESARETVTVRPVFTPPPRENTLPPASTPYEPSDVKVSAYCFFGRNGSSSIDPNAYKLGVSIENTESDPEKGAIRVLSVYYHIFDGDDRVIDSGILGEGFTIQAFGAKMLETMLIVPAEAADPRADVTVIWVDSEGREGTLVINGNSRIVY